MCTRSTSSPRAVAAAAMHLASSASQSRNGASFAVNTEARSPTTSGGGGSSPPPHSSPMSVAHRSLGMPPARVCSKNGLDDKTAFSAVRRVILKPKVSKQLLPVANPWQKRRLSLLLRLLEERRLVPDRLGHELREGCRRGSVLRRLRAAPPAPPAKPRAGGGNPCACRSCQPHPRTHLSRCRNRATSPTRPCERCRAPRPPWSGGRRRRAARPRGACARPRP